MHNSAVEINFWTGLENPLSASVLLSRLFIVIFLSRIFYAGESVKYVRRGGWPLFGISKGGDLRKYSLKNEPDIFSVHLFFPPTFSNPYFISNDSFLIFFFNEAVLDV